jgi:hypothetical protein
MPIKATITANGSAPPASGEPNGIEAAMAAPGAIEHMDWNTTSRSPMALRSKRGAESKLLNFLSSF